MWYLLESIFPKYKIKKYGNGWVITKRRLLFFSRILTHNKYVLEDDSNRLRPGCPSYEILFFDTREAVESELDRLDFGYKPVKSRVYQKGVMIEEKYR